MATDLETRLKKLESLATKAKDSKSSGSSWGWLVALIVGAIVSIGAALLLNKLNKKNEELAKLRTKIEQKEVEAAQRKFEGTIAKLRGDGNQLLASAKVLETKVQKAKVLLEQEEEKHLQQLERIADAKNWDDLNKLAP
jgi:hypothetical protein